MGYLRGKDGGREERKGEREGDGEGGRKGVLGKVYTQCSYPTHMNSYPTHVYMYSCIHDTTHVYMHTHFFMMLIPNAHIYTHYRSTQCAYPLHL